MLEKKKHENNCDYNVPLAKCEEIIQTFVSKNSASKSRFHQGNWNHLPHGCSVAIDAATNKYWQYWNHKKTGDNNGNLNKICAPKPKLETTYKLGIKGTNACDYPAENVPKNKCNEAVRKSIPKGARIGGSYDGNYPSVPAGCNVHSSGNYYYQTFNNIDGKNRGKYIPVCQILPYIYLYISIYIYIYLYIYI